MQNKPSRQASLEDIQTPEEMQKKISDIQSCKMSPSARNNQELYYQYERQEEVAYELLKILTSQQNGGRLPTNEEGGE